MKIFLFLAILWTFLAIYIQCNQEPVVLPAEVTGTWYMAEPFTHPDWRYQFDGAYTFRQWIESPSGPTEVFESIYLVDADTVTIVGQYPVPTRRWIILETTESSIKVDHEGSKLQPFTLKRL